jgi:hypothetical protein
VLCGGERESPHDYKCIDGMHISKLLVHDQRDMHIKQQERAFHIKQLCICRMVSCVCTHNTFACVQLIALFARELARLFMLIRPYMWCVRAHWKAHTSKSRVKISLNKPLYANLLQGAEVGEDGHWKRGQLIRAQTKNPVGRREAEG